MIYLKTLLSYIWTLVEILFSIGVLLALAFIIVGVIQEIKERKKHGRK